MGWRYHGSANHGDGTRGALNVSPPTILHIGRAFVPSDTFALVVHRGLFRASTHPRPGTGLHFIKL